MENYFFAVHCKLSWDMGHSIMVLYAITIHMHWNQSVIESMESVHSTIRDSFQKYYFTVTWSTMQNVHIKLHAQWCISETLDEKYYRV